MKELDKLLDVMRALRDPESGCPWDREQTIASIRGYTLEEVYEVVDAIERESMSDLCDELGDLLFHIVFYAEMAKEQGAFDFRDVLLQVCEKLERRHPHVFANMKVENSDDVKKLWEETKQKERQDRESKQKLLLDDISSNLPAMHRAYKLQKRAASVGFDWTESSDILLKIEEELDELKENVEQDRSRESIADELGDLLFCCINLARHYHIDPELALRQTNNKFVTRFNYIENSLSNDNKTLNETSLEVMDRLWNEAKTRG